MTPAPSVAPASIRSRLGVTEHDPVEIDGFGISGTLRPRDAKEMAQAELHRFEQGVMEERTFFFF